MSKKKTKKILLETEKYHFAYKDDHNIDAPIRLLYADFRLTIPLTKVDLHGYRLHHQVFRHLESPSFGVMYLNFDHCSNFSPDWLISIRGKLTLKGLSLEGMKFDFDQNLLSIITSCTNLVSLNLKKNKFQPASFKDITRLTSLKFLNLSFCEGIDDYAMVALANLCKMGRSLEKIDLSNSGPFQDEALIEFIQAGMNFLTDVKIKSCSQLTALSLSGFNVKMEKLESLNISNLHLTPTVYSWITMGCRRLTSITVSQNESLNDASLGLIGKCCQFLISLDISNCLSVTDKGIQFFFESFLGQLENINLNNCLNCGNDGISLFIHQKNLKEVRFNSLSKVTDQTLKLLFQNCSQLEYFEMCCELKPTSKSTVSTVPHLSDKSLTKMTCGDSLKHFIVAGAIMISNVGIESLVTLCPNILTLNFSFCSKINDLGLEILSKNCLKLQSLNLTACVFVTDQGIFHLCHGKFHHLKHLELNGCQKVTDKGIKLIAKFFPLIENLSLRACDLITDEGIKCIGKHCHQLTALDLTNDDYITIESINYLTNYCWKLKTLECSGTGLLPQEFSANSCPTKYFPFAKPANNRCFLEKRSLSVIQFNKYQLIHHNYLMKLKILFRFHIFFKQYKDIIHQRMMLARDHSLKEYIFSMLKLHVQSNLRKRRRIVMRNAVKKIQRAMKRWYNKRLAKRKLLFLRTEKHSVITIQRYYRGFHSRKRTKLRFLRFKNCKKEWLQLVGRYFMVFHARKLKKTAIRLQNWMRRCLTAWKYNLFKKSIMLLQVKYKSKFRWLQRKYQKELTQKEIDKMLFVQRDQAIRIIQKNVRNILFNRMMSSFTLYCALVQYSNHQEGEWHATILQKYWRGYATRIRKTRQDEINSLKNQFIIKLQSKWRSYLHQKKYQIAKIYFQRNFLRWKKIAIFAMPKIRLGFYVKKIQRRYRLYSFRCHRYYAGIRVFQWYKYQQWKYLQNDAFYKYQNDCVSLIQSYWKAYKYKKARRLYHARRHMAAFKIFVSLFFLPS